jgi:hypothetical protein
VALQFRAHLYSMQGPCCISDCVELSKTKTSQSSCNRDQTQESFISHKLA